jgi:HEAT repeat protein
LEGKSVGEWEKLLRVGDATARAQAGLGLSKLGPAAAAATPALIEALKDDKPLVRQNAAVALQAIGPEARSAIPTLIAALGDSEWTVRRQAALALGAIGADPRSAAALRKASNDKNSLVQRAAMEALKQVGG